MSKESIKITEDKNDFLPISLEKAKSLLMSGYEISGYHAEAGIEDIIYPHNIKALPEYENFWLEEYQAESAGINQQVTESMPLFKAEVNPNKPIALISIPETQLLPSIAIKQLLKQKEWKNITPHEINNGSCDEFANDIQESCGGKIVETPWNSNLPTHMFIEWRDKYYDAQHPDGVDNWLDLSTFDSAKKKEYKDPLLTEKETDNEKYLRQKIEKYLGQNLPKKSYKETSQSEVLDGAHRTSRKIGEFFGKEVVFFQTTSKNIFTFDGTTFGNNKIYVDIKSHRSPLFILGHELFHEIKRDHEDLYGQILFSLSDQLQNFSKYKQEYLKNIEDVAVLNDEKIKDELHGDLLGSMFTKQSFWDALSVNNSSLFKGLVTKQDSDDFATYFKDAGIVEETIAYVVTEYGKRQQASQMVSAKSPKPKKKGTTVNQEGVSAKLESTRGQGTGNGWHEQKDAHITSISGSLKKDIDQLPENIKSQIKEIKIYGSYIRDREKANDIDIHVRVVNNKDYGPQEYSDLGDAIEDWINKKGFKDSTGKNIDLMIEPDEIGMGMEKGKGIAIYTASTPTPKVSKVTKKASLVKKTSLTEDAGAELAYNKRNRIKTGIKWTDIKDKETALRVKEITKQNVYPRPDYQRLVDAGMDRIKAYYVKQVYDSIASKPPQTSDEILQEYIESVTHVMTETVKWAYNPEGSLFESVYPYGSGDLRIFGGSKIIGALSPGYSDTRKAERALAKGWPAKREKYQVRGYKVVETAISAKISEGYSNDDETKFSIWLADRVHKYQLTKSEADKALAELKPFLLLGRGGQLVDEFDSKKTAIEAAREIVKTTKKAEISDKGVPVEAVVRTGEERRSGDKDITSEELMNTFGFKGVNFGNWMKGKSNEVERQLHLNYTYDSFMDLADILRLPPKAMSLNGMLGIAIGAQGTGAYAAHFVPGLNEINLTRTNGAGSLAHEFGHAMDHYFGNMAGVGASREPYLTEHSGANHSDTFRPEIAQHFKIIVESMNKRQVSKEEIDAKISEKILRYKRNIENWLKYIRGSFVGHEEEFNKLADRMLNLDYGGGVVPVGKRSHFFPVVVEMRQLHKKVNGLVYSMKDSKGLQTNLYSFQQAQYKEDLARDHKPQKTVSDFAKKADGLDKGKGGKNYWGTNVEKFARAFDAFVSDTLKANAAKNTYLSHADRTGDTVPEGDERIAINKAFAGLISEFKTKKVDGKQVLLTDRMRSKSLRQMPTM